MVELANSKQVILSALFNKVEQLCNEGCSIGKVHTEQVIELKRRMGESDIKQWWLISISFVTLIGVAFNLAVAYAQLNLKENIQYDYKQKYPTP